ncbi:MAG: hypothetical protein A3G11_01165 [Candidatus Lloydbacteria bacterium RIFCSPLOWO2_12_FULL_51_9]|uniref:Uncharacterized protein n=2 Tax=Candidatus Lloydiibacteriota TaxID=1817910 RepID=A0A1G2DRP1_9BACT|nr:MAG: hypothetical protein A3J08_03045 [Candidatus Lloydbacteria bacterium RIFCSPLOWO2_02_FULL_51_11]OGZ16287.1 MAG: hypothetical protein A3G11_01165 [Candidatus Lloydbacteria bacterium RIFCSPLOWO2_12_FULL_51_9]
MNRGKWYFAYTLRDTFGGGLACTIEHVEIPLKATNEIEAVAEARAYLETQKKAYWETQKKERALSPASLFQDGTPRTPSVIYKISLQ